MLEGYRVDPIGHDGYTVTRQQRSDLTWEAAMEKARVLSGKLNDVGALRYERVEVRDGETGMVMAIFQHGDRMVADHRTGHANA